MKRRFYFDLIVMLCCLAVFSLQAQNSSSEKEQAEQAKKLFEKKEFGKAEAFYSQLLSNHPENILYEYYFGICQLYSANKRAEAIHHLFQACSSTKVPAEVYYYLGRAYHLNSKFDDAVLAYREFEKRGSKSQLKELEIALLESMCQSGVKIRDNGMHSLILDQTEVAMDKFLTQYNFTSKMGKFVPTPDNYKTVEDKTAGINQFIYLTSGTKSFYFAGMPKGIKSIDLFKVDKTPDGNWGKAVAVDTKLNTAYDESYPTTSEDGKTLYFSSRGPGSIGGYDIFRSVYDEKTKAWTDPENLGLPINSTDDDFYFVPSSKDKAAWFCSTRECSPGTVKVIKVKFSESENGIHIKGVFYCIDQKQLRSARITVYNPVDNSIVAEIKSDNSNGSYEMNLPNLKEYLFNVDLDGYAVHSETINFNDKPEGVAEINQEINIKKDNTGNEEFSIINIYPGQVKDQSHELTANDEGSSGSKEVEPVKEKAESSKETVETKKIEKAKEVIPNPADNGSANFSGTTEPVKTDKADTSNPLLEVTAPANSNAKPVNAADKSGNENSAKQEPARALASSDPGKKIKNSKENTGVNLSITDQKQDKEASSIAVKEKPLFTINQEVNISSDKIIFKIQLGIYITKPVKEIIEKYKSKGITHVAYRTDETGFNYFYVGAEKDYASAQIIKSELISKGMEGVFIVAFNNDKQVPLPEAINLSSR